MGEFIETKRTTAEIKFIQEETFSDFYAQWYLLFR